MIQKIECKHADRIVHISTLLQKRLDRSYKRAVRRAEVIKQRSNKVATKNSEKELKNKKRDERIEKRTLQEMLS